MFLVTLGNNFISSVSTSNNNICNILLGEHLLSAMQFIFISLSKVKKENTLSYKWHYLHLKSKKHWALIFSNFPQNYNHMFQS